LDFIFDLAKGINGARL